MCTGQKQPFSTTIASSARAEGTDAASHARPAPAVPSVSEVGSQQTIPLPTRLQAPEGGSVFLLYTVYSATLTYLLTYLLSHSRGTPLSHPHCPVGQLRSRVVEPEYVGHRWWGQGGYLLTTTPFPRRIPPVKSFVAVLNKSLVQVVFTPGFQNRPSHVFHGA